MYVSLASRSLRAMTQISANVAVVIPCFKVRSHILEVIGGIGPIVSRIYVVDDCCPEGTGKFVAAHCGDRRVKVLRTPANSGVGGAVILGYRTALADGMEVVVKIDGDGQMDTTLIPEFVAPILSGEADYAKGNRFYDLEALTTMPRVRLFGNAMLSLLAKLSTGYWNLFDPTNGYTAIHIDVLRELPLSKLSNRYFFETDMLFRLNILRAVVVDIPMEARYGNEVSNLRISKILGEFLWKHTRNTLKRIFYNYYLRDLSLASIELPLGLLMMTFGIVFGGYHWLSSAQGGVPTPAGTVMLAALPVLTGLQLLLAFVGFDVASIPRRPRQRQKWITIWQGDTTGEMNRK